MSSSLIFPFVVELDVRGYEIDAFGHVNNAVYLQWLEHIRWEMSRVGGFAMVFEDIFPVVRHMELDYRAETKLGDRLRLATWPRRLGNTSFTLGASMRVIAAAEPKRVDWLAFVAAMTLTCVHRLKGSKVPVPDAWRTYFPAADPGSEPPPGL